jgi:hypothetical protein
MPNVSCENSTTWRPTVGFKSPSSHSAPVALGYTTKRTRRPTKTPCPRAESALLGSQDLLRAERLTAI